MLITYRLTITKNSTISFLFRISFKFQHCIKGKSIYAPDIIFLNCGGSSSKPRGSWYHYSYGTIAMYKEDWENFGGFSASFSNKTTWGAEDWDLIDRAVRGGLEIERKRSPWVYHYHHSKAGMWNGMKPTERTSWICASSIGNLSTSLRLVTHSPNIHTSSWRELSNCFWFSAATNYNEKKTFKLELSVSAWQNLQRTKVEGNWTG